MQGRSGSQILKRATDENDKLLAGMLPDDPTEGTEVVSIPRASSSAPTWGTRNALWPGFAGKFTTARLASAGFAGTESAGFGTNSGRSISAPSSRCAASTRRLETPG